MSLTEFVYGMCEIEPGVGADGVHLERLSYKYRVCRQLLSLCGRYTSSEHEYTDSDQLARVRRESEVVSVFLQSTGLQTSTYEDISLTASRGS